MRCDWNYYIISKIPFVALTSLIRHFDFNANPKINQSMIRDLATCRFIKEGSPVIIEGPCGTGKTHIAQAIGHCAVQSGYDVILTSQTKLAQQLQSAKALNTYEQTMKRIAKVPLLIIDDFGLKPLRSPEDEYLHELIAERSEFKSTLITSNLSTHECIRLSQISCLALLRLIV